MKKILFLLLVLILFTSSLKSQSVLPIQATTGAVVSELLFDDNNNMYFLGSICGRIWVNGKYNDSYSSKYQLCLAKFKDDFTFEWVTPLSVNPQDIAVFNNKIYMISVRDKDAEDQKLYLCTYNTSGDLINTSEIFDMSEENFVYSKAQLYDDCILIATTWKGEMESVILESEKHTKKKYSQVIFSKRDNKGNEEWSYTIEGGIDGFTDIRIQNISRDNDGNFFIFSYFSHSVDLGSAQFTTKPIYPEVKSRPLYYHAVFFMKLSSEGEVLMAEVFAENDVTVNDVCHLSDGKMIIGGYHRGNDTFAAAQEDGRPYVGAKFRNTAFVYTPQMSIEGPTDDAFLLQTDSNLNILWKYNFYGTGNNRITDIQTAGKRIFSTGIFSKTIHIHNDSFEDHSENNGYSDGFYLECSEDGMISNIQVFKGPESNIPQLFTDKTNLPVISIQTKSFINLYGKDYKGYGRWGGSFIIR